jgi:hypothetical protein
MSESEKTRSVESVEVYEEPRLHQLGEVSNLTLGAGGSSMDGTYKINQLGGGNDGKEPHGG